MDKDKLYYTVDRLEGEYAVLEHSKNRKMYNVKLKYLPNNISDGDILIVKDGKFVKDDETKKTREEIIREKFERLKRRD